MVFELAGRWKLRQRPDHRGWRVSRADALFAVLLALLSTSLSYRFGTGNQVEVLPIILRQLDPAYLPNDFFLATSAEFGPRFYFSHLLAWVSRVLPLQWSYFTMTFLTDLALVSVTFWAARRIIDQGLGELLINSDGLGRSWQLREQVLNALVGGDSFPFVEDARFYLRADHVTFSARLSSSRDTYELLTVGQMERTGPASMQYRIEAIFIDGMPIDPNDPDVQREIYQGHLLGINLESLMPADATAASFEQQNGLLQFQFQ